MGKEQLKASPTRTAGVLLGNVLSDWERERATSGGVMYAGAPKGAVSYSAAALTGGR